MASNGRIAQHLTELADLLELQGANPFRVRAYRTAARTVEGHDRPLRAMVEAGEDLEALRGVGTDIAAAIEELVREGHMAALEEARAGVPEGLLEITRIPGVGPKRARALHEELGIDGLPALEAAAREGRIQSLSGFGAKSQQRILEGIASVQRFAERHRRVDAEVAVGPLVEALHEEAGVARVAVAGSYRRGLETVGDADVLVETTDAAMVMERVRTFEEVAEVLWSGPEKTSVRLDAGLQVDVRTVPAESFGAALLYFTGSKEHGVALRGRAQAEGRILNEYGLFEEADDGEAGARLAGATEEEVYAALGLAWIPPELREARGEVEAAEAGTLPHLIEPEDVRADLHVHTTWSDGKASPREMAEAAHARGLEVLAITDHSPALAMARGLSPERLRRQWEELDTVRAEVDGITLLRGMEVDVLEGGALDMEEDLLAEMDVVIASVHSRFGLDEEAQTERVLQAVRHPRVNVLGHPTGRLINAREPFALDLDRVFAAAAEARVALEINASPSRLDLRDTLARTAARAGAVLSINTDAHTVGELGLGPHGVRVARRAWLEPASVINTWSWPKLRDFLAKR